MVYIKKNHLLRNLFFYASAVNVHIVAVWCSVTKKRSVLVIVSENCRGRNGLPEIFHRYISDFIKMKLLRTGFHKERKRKGNTTKYLHQNVATLTGLINIRQTTTFTSCVKGKFPLCSFIVIGGGKNHLRVLFVFLQIFLLKKKNKIFKSDVVVYFISNESKVTKKLLWSDKHAQVFYT